MLRVERLGHDGNAVRRVRVRGDDDDRNAAKPRVALHLDNREREREHLLNGMGLIRLRGQVRYAHLSPNVKREAVQLLAAPLHRTAHEG